MLRDQGIIQTDTDGTRTYRISLPGRLSAETVDALKRDERWALAFLRKEPLPPVRGLPPVIRFERDDEDAIDLDAPEEGEHVPSDTSPNMVDNVVLMRIITDQARMIKDLRTRLGEPDEGYRPSAEVADFLTELL